MAVFGTLEIPNLVRAGSVCTAKRSAYTRLGNLGKHKQTQMSCLLYTYESISYVALNLFSTLFQCYGIGKIVFDKL